MDLRLKNDVTPLVYIYRRLLVSIVRAKEVQQVSRKAWYFIMPGWFLHYFIFCNVVLYWNVSCILQPSLVLQTVNLFSHYRKKKKTLKRTWPVVHRKITANRV